MKSKILIVILAFLTSVLAIDWSKVIVDEPYIEPKGFHGIENEQESSVRISKGKPAKSKQFPYQVGLSITIMPYLLNRWCGGSLISDRFVLTAAHCIFNNRYELLSNGSIIKIDYEYVWPSDLTVYIGGYDLNKEEEFQKIFVPSGSDYIVHDDYNPIEVVNDIALVHLPKPAILNDFAKIIKLPPANIGNLIGETLVSSGWGITSDNADQNSPSTLQYVKLEVISARRCSWTFGSIENDKHLCVQGQNKKNTCLGDSGGPNVYKGEDNIDYLVGITSFGAKSGCSAGYPSVFSRVSHYIDWITEKTNNTIH